MVAIAPYLSSLGAEEGVTKVLILKGKASAIDKDGKSSPLKLEQWLKKGIKVKTEKGSFAKLLFVDKSTINVGPNSEMEISSFPKSEAGVLTILQGTIRSQVTKNYMEIQDKDKSKLFIKTKTAAMGVRGTDFIAGYDKATGASSLDVISGSVAMATIDENAQLDQSALEKAVSGDNAVMVEKGFQCDVNAGAAKPSEPIKIPEGELNKLNSDENSVATDEKGHEEEKKEEIKEDKKEDKSSGVEKQSDYAILTNEITKAWSGMTVKDYKKLKDLKK